MTDIVKSTMLAMFSGFVGLTSLFLLSSHLGVADYGTYTAYITAGMWLNLLVFQWLRLSYIRYGAQSKILSVITGVQIIFFGLIFFTLLFLYFYGEGKAAMYSLLLVPVVAMNELYASHLRVFNMIDRFLKYQFIRPVLFIAALLVGIMQGYELNYFYCVVLLSYLLPFVLFGGWVIYRKLSNDIQVHKEKFIYGFHASLVALVGYSFVSGAKYSIFIAFGDAALGRLALPLDIIYQGFTAIFMAIHAVSFNKILNRYNEIRKYNSDYMYLYKDFLFVLCCGAIFLGVSLSGAIEMILISTEFSASFSHVFALSSVVFALLYLKICYIDTYYQLSGKMKGQVLIAFPIMLLVLISNYLFYRNGFGEIYFLYSLAAGVLMYFVLGSFLLYKEGLGLGFGIKYFLIVMVVFLLSLLIKYALGSLGYWWNMTVIILLPLFLILYVLTLNPMRFRDGLRM